MIQNSTFIMCFEREVAALESMLENLHTIIQTMERMNHWRADDMYELRSGLLEELKSARQRLTAARKDS